MVRFPIPPSALAWTVMACWLAAPPALRAQHERNVPTPVEVGPFSADTAREKPVSIEFRAADQLTKQDQLLLADAESSIAEHAGFAGLDFQRNNWSYRQIVCPSFPNHLFLQYTRDNGEGDRSVFSASIPRNGDGRVRIVPILKRSYSLFSPAPINALTVSAFNHIRAEEGESVNADWLGNALCYAALAGARPEIASADAEPAVHKPMVAMNAQMEIQLQSHGQEVIRFDDAAARPRPMEWTMTFTRKGKLIKATHRPADVFTAKPVAQKSAVGRTSPVPQSGPNP